MSNQQGANRAYSMGQWQRDFAKAFAAAVPIEGTETTARGALLAADNDEPEPLFSEEQLIEADRGYEQQKAAGFPDRYERALHEQMNRRPA